MKTPAQTSQRTDINTLKESVAGDLTTLNQLIKDSLHSPIPLIQNVVSHILDSGGKRIRPLIVLLLANHFDGQSQHQQIELAAIIEFVHTATLLHDDVIDHSSMRRGHDTANSLWGNQASILVGDFLYSRAFQLLSKRCDDRIMKRLSFTTNTLAEGEILQLANQGGLISEKTYLDTIYRKTAALFEAACECAAITALQTPAIQQACALYGKLLGLIFQIQDDLLDYTATNQSLGKNHCEDIREGKATLPLIYTYQQATPAEQRLLIEALEQKNSVTETDIMNIILRYDAIARCQSLAERYAEQALSTLSTLSDTPYQKHLATLIEFSLTRRH